MISRRNIRVKVMQTLYTVESLEDAIQAKKMLEKHLEQSRQLIVYLIHSITKIAQYAERDAAQRSSKHLPTADDLNVNVKIAGNEILWSILEHPSLQRAVKEIKPYQWDNEDLIRKTYTQLTQSPVYATYIAQPERTKKDEKSILEFIFTDLILANEDFVAHIEDNFIHWDDDAEMMNQLVLNFLQKQSSANFDDMLGKDKRDFAFSLLETVIDKKEHCQELIKPKLKNWDVDRIAVLDMILMEMGVCELLYFETIPTKVTINEYIDLAKEYSTTQSGQFVNGILDNIHKELLAANKINKVAFKKP